MLRGRLRMPGRRLRRRLWIRTRVQRDLLRQLRDLGARVESGSDAELGRVNDELGRLIQQVRQHEVEESEVLQAAYGVDLGGSG